MHHALEIQEILSNVFLQLSPQIADGFTCGYRIVHRPDPVLAALARMCRAFKEPALDALWYALENLSPLARCIPEASLQLSLRKYSFKRSLTSIECDILRSYARRVRFVMDFDRGLDQDSVMTFMITPTPDPLFPNLRNLYYDYDMEGLPLLRQPLPSLTFLTMKFRNPNSFRKSTDPIPKFSPNVQEFSLHVLDYEDVSFITIESDCIYRLKNLCSVDFPRTVLDVNALVHLSRMPALNRLYFALNDTPRTSAPLVYSNLEYLQVRSESISAIVGFLSLSRLPIIVGFLAEIYGCPSKQEFSSFLVGILTSNPRHTIKSLTLTQSFPPTHHRPHTLGFEDIRPCMKFGNLRDLHLDIQHSIDLTDSQVLTLASAWPGLECFIINERWAWTSPSPRGGVTPGGLVRLFQTCPSLHSLSLCLNTRGYTQVAPSETPEALELMLPYRTHVDVLDAAIEQEAIPAVATFFSGFAARCQVFILGAWESTPMHQLPNWWQYQRRWDHVRHVALGLGSDRSSDADEEAE